MTAPSIRSRLLQELSENTIDRESKRTRKKAVLGLIFGKHTAQKSVQNKTRYHRRKYKSDNCRGPVGDCWGKPNKDIVKVHKNTFPNFNNKMLVLSRYMVSI